MPPKESDSEKPSISHRDHVNYDLEDYDGNKANDKQDSGERTQTISTNLTDPTTLKTNAVTVIPTGNTDLAATTISSSPSPTPTLHTNDAVDHAPSNSIPDGGYGWLVCLSCFLINGFTWGVMASYGVYLSYYLSHSTFRSGSPMLYAFIGGCNFASAMLVAPLMGHLIKLLRGSTNLTILLGSFVYAGGFVAASFSRELYQLVLSQGVVVGIGVGVIWQPSTPILPQWFLRRRSLAQGIASAGSGLGGLVFSLATTPMIERLGLAWALRITGLVAWVVLVVAAGLIRDRNLVVKPNRARAFDTKLLRQYKVRLLLGWACFSILGYIVLLYSLSSYALAIGCTQRQGGIVIAIQNLGTGVGRPFVGVASDRLGRMTVAFALTAFTAVICFAVWIPATTYAVLIFFALTSGATLGTFWATIAPLAAEVVDLTDLPSMLSLSWLFISLPTLFSQPIALELRQPGSSKPYLYVQLYAGLCYIIASAFMFELRRSKWGLWKREKHR